MPPRTAPSLRYAEFDIVQANATPGRDGLGIQLSPQIIGLCFDLDASLAWFTADGVSWNNTSGANPETGIGGNAFSLSGPLYFAVSCLTDQNPVTVNFGQAPLAYGVPSGFSVWGATEQFNPADVSSSLVVGGDGFSVYPTQTSSAWALGRTIGAKTSGKVYIEVPFFGAASNGIIVGLATSGAPLNNYLGSSNGVGWQCTDNLWGFSSSVGAPRYAPGIYSVEATGTSFSEYFYASDGVAFNHAPGLDTWTTGDVVGVAFNEATGYIWWRVNGGNWNSDPTADPVSGSGGISTGYSGVAQLFVNFQVSGSEITIKPAGGFSFTEPSGYYTWDGEAPELLSITSASYASNTLTVDGLCENSILSTLDISTDGGGTFTPATSLSVTGGVYTSTLTGSLANGSYVLQSKDSDTSVLSNLFTFTISATETLTLSTVSLDATRTLDATGTVSNAALVALNLSSNGGATFGPATFSTSGTTWAASNGALSAGTYTIQAQDGLTNVLSNTETLVVSGEQITLTTLSGTLTGLLGFGGTTSGGTSTAMDISVNGSWGTPGAFSGGSPFTGTGPTISSYGTYVVQLRDHTNHYVLSNTETLVVVPNETITLTSATGVYGGLLDIGGNTSGATPAGLNVSLDGGATYAPNGGYSDVSGTWTATGISPLSAGVKIVQVQDDVYPSIVSNQLTLTIASPAETITLTAAYGLVNTPLQLAGNTYNGPAPSLDVTLDNGITWGPTNDYTTSGNTSNAPWTAAGNILAAGGYTIRVRDHANPSVISNPITLTVQPASGGGGGGQPSSFGLSPNGRTLFLIPSSWDLCLDTNGNIAVANNPYATAQDVSSAVRLFLGELWYNTAVGVPYFQDIMGKELSFPFLTAKLQAAALSVPRVTSAHAVIASAAGRTVTGQIQFTTLDDPNPQIVGF